MERTEALTPQQREVKDLLGKGLSPRQVAAIRKVTTQAVYEMRRRLIDMGHNLPPLPSEDDEGAA